jgi:hypothetical protein
MNILIVLRWLSDMVGYPIMQLTSVHCSSRNDRFKLESSGHLKARIQKDENIGRVRKHIFDQPSSASSGARMAASTEEHMIEGTCSGRWPFIT